jgi:hypothetical protein
MVERGLMAAFAGRFEEASILLWKRLGSSGQLYRLLFPGF